MMTALYREFGWRFVAVVCVVVLLGAALPWIAGFRIVLPPIPAEFAAGNARYATGDYAGAVKAYEGEVRSGRYGANLFYNLGDAYYRLGDKGRAVLNYRRSLLLEPAQAEAAANLAFVRGGQPVRGQSGGLAEWWQVAPLLAAVCGWLGLAGVLLAVASPRRRASGVGLAVVGLLLCGLTTGLTWYFDGAASTARTAVVVVEATPALYSPADNSKVITTLAAGGEIHVLSEQGAWIYVLLADGTTRAWLSAEKVERLVPR